MPWSIETGPGRQRRLAHQVAAQGEDDPFRHAEPGRGRAGRLPAGAQPQQLGQGGLARPPQARGALEGGGESGGLAGQLLDLVAAAVIEPGDHRGGRPPGRVEQHAALGQAGHADGAYPDRAPGGFGRPDGAPDQVHGQADEAVRVDLGLAAGVRLPRGGLLRKRAAVPRRGPGHGLGRGGADVEAHDDARGHGRCSPEPRSMSLAGTWMRSTGRPGWSRRARSRAAATRPTS